MRKYIHTIYFMIQINIVLSENYCDMMNFIAEKLAEPITNNTLKHALAMLPTIL